MWASTAVASAAGLTIGATMVMMRRKSACDQRVDDSGELSARIEAIQTARDAVRLLQTMCRRSPTEDVVARLEEAVNSHGISEVAVARLSQIHRQRGDDLGAEGYAIALIWSTVLYAIQEGGAIIVA